MLDHVMKVEFCTIVCLFMIQFAACWYKIEFMYSSCALENFTQLGN